MEASSNPSVEDDVIGAGHTLAVSRRRLQTAPVTKIGSHAARFKIQPHCTVPPVRGSWTSWLSPYSGVNLAKQPPRQPALRAGHSPQLGREIRRHRLQPGTPRRRQPGVDEDVAPACFSQHHPRPWPAGAPAPLCPTMRTAGRPPALSAITRAWRLVRRPRHEGPGQVGNGYRVSVPGQLLRDRLPGPGADQRAMNQQRPSFHALIRTTCTLDGRRPTGLPQTAGW
jgi:hypothetical protein